jgi:acid phosphatase type 7
MLNFILFLSFISCALAHTVHPNSLIDYDSIVVTYASDANISVSPPVILNNDVVQVSYSLPSYVKVETVFIAAYSPSTVDITKTAPIEYKSVSTLSGTLSFTLVNMRADYVFIAFNGSLSKPVEMGRSNLVEFENYNQPRAPRLMVEKKETEMRVTWSSATNIYNPRILYGPKSSPQSSWIVVAAESTTYFKSQLCGPPATTVGYREPGWLHSAVMTNLVPGEEYSYLFGDDSEFTVTPNSFIQPARKYPFSVAMYGDEGQSFDDPSIQIERYFAAAPNNSRLIYEWKKSDPSVVGCVHIGDISYAMGYESTWDIFTEMNSKLSSQMFYAVIVGNHESDYPNTNTINCTDSGGECSIPTAYQFPTPRSDISRLWYSFVTGPLFVVMMSTEHDFSNTSEQYAFIENALLNVDRSVTPFVLFAGHRPGYIDSTNSDPETGDQTIAVELRKYIEPLLLNAGGSPVDVCIWGHHHSYQRGAASFGGVGMQNSVIVNGERVYLQPKYPLHMVIGTGGAGFSTNIQPTLPSYTEEVLFEHGFVKFTLLNSTALEWTFISAANGTVLDHFYLLK